MGGVARDKIQKLRYIEDMPVTNYIFLQYLVRRDVVSLQAHQRQENLRYHIENFGVEAKEWNLLGHKVQHKLY